MFWILFTILSITLLAVLTGALILYKKWRHEYLSSQLLAIKSNQLESQMYDYENQFQSIFDNARTGLALLSLDGRFIKANHALCQLLGFSHEELMELNYYHFVDANHQRELQIRIQELLDHKIMLYRAEEEWYRKNNEVIWIFASLSLIRNLKDVPTCFILQVEDITLQKHAEERLKHMAYHDPLTGLANRNKFEQIINHILATARRNKQSFALLFLDLDHFKHINDSIGHEEGDLILQIIAERLRNTVRTTDIVARLGGDEFILLITDIKQSESVALIAKKILENILKVIVLKSQEIYLTTSIGISLYPYDGQTMQVLMKNADLAMYRAKEHGRNNYQFYAPEMTAKAKKKLELQNALGHALVKNEFVLQYQPTMTVKNRYIKSIEALLRWKNKEYEVITPDEIILLAEETGLIIPVNGWIFKTACEQLKYWHDMGFPDLTISLNCSSRLFKHAAFVDDLLAILTEVGLAPSAINLEVTERTIMEDSATALRILDSLKDMGIKIVIDDFGTGYWSLSHLKKLSVDKIKIDKSFIAEMLNNPISANIVRSIIAMTKKLGIISIAEGVETQEQYQFLAQEGCDEIQGYYLTQPLDSDAMTQFLKHPIPDAETITENEIS